VLNEVHVFNVDLMSSFYFETSKDRLYLQPTQCQSRRACQTVLLELLKVLLKSLAPIACHAAEHIFQHVAPSLRPLFNQITDKQQSERDSSSLSPSLFGQGWIFAKADWKNEKVHAEWQLIRRIRSHVQAVLEKARQEYKLIGRSLEAHVQLQVDDNCSDLVLLQSIDWSAVLVTSSATFSSVSLSHFQVPANAAPSIDPTRVDAFFHDRDSQGNKLVLRVCVSRTTGDKCPRCWKYSHTKHPNCLCQRCQSVLAAMPATSVELEQCTT